MTNDSRIIAGFYVIALLLPMATGLQAGFTHSHTVPLPVLLHVFFIFCGLIWATTDLFIWIVNRKGNRFMLLAHVGGLVTNGLMFYRIVFY
ncbi:MAG: hypothetical protein HOP30_00030 [Cyclobacteriaceae bacterium]|nr:hypothetical protein [Cyclobacteriaceae bacterium]